MWRVVIARPGTAAVKRFAQRLNARPWGGRETPSTTHAAAWHSSWASVCRIFGSESHTCVDSSTTARRSQGAAGFARRLVMRVMPDVVRRRLDQTHVTAAFRRPPTTVAS